jgi:hypothetical protein
MEIAYAGVSRGHSTNGKKMLGRPEHEDEDMIGKYMRLQRMQKIRSNNEEPSARSSGEVREGYLRRRVIL